MRHLVGPLLIVSGFTCEAQPVFSAQNGFWDQPSTWDCECVPSIGHLVAITHSVEIAGDLLIASQTVQIMAGGELRMSFPANITLNTNLSNAGHMLLMGNIDNTQYFNNWGFAEFIGQFNNLGLITPHAVEAMQVEGNFNNGPGATLIGEGAVCVTDLTVNMGGSWERSTSVIRPRQ